jgi:hypothetical protein
LSSGQAKAAPVGYTHPAGLDIFANRSTSLRATGSRECAKQSSEAHAGWIASSQGLLAMTVAMFCRNTSVRGPSPAHQQDGLDLDRHPVRQRSHVDRGAGVAACLAEHIDEEIGAAVDDLGMVGEPAG